MRPLELKEGHTSLIRYFSEARVNIVLKDQDPGKEAQAD